ncbi:methyltransferase [Marinobacter sp. 1Y8]
MRSDNRFECGEHLLDLERPGRGGRDLRAWDAADELLLEYTDAHISADGVAAGKLAIIDDAFGVLTLALNASAPVSIADSALLSQALRKNAGPNGLSVPTVMNWQDPPKGPFDLIVLKIPRQLDYLEYLLRWSNTVLSPKGRVVAGGMIKHLPDRCADLFAKAMASNEPQRAKRKARVIVAARGEATLDGWANEQKGFSLPSPGTGAIETTAPHAMGMPAVFARERLDIGTRVFLPQVSAAVDRLAASARVLDLGCGNGVVGLSALIERPDLNVDFADVSSQAIASARGNVGRCFPSAIAGFHHTDGVPQGEHYDLILCNPPFHEGGTVGDHIALRMFRQASQALNSGGALLVVGNRHLGYHAKLKKDFAGVEQRAADPKFVVLEARKLVAR